MIHTMYSLVVRRMRQSMRVCFFTVGVAIGMMCMAAHASSQDIAMMPQASEAFASGVQIYTCSSRADAYAWQLKAPDATLKDAKGNVVGKHFAGPTWQASDGSSVTGEVMNTSASPDAGAIPWLVLRAKAHDGAGTMAKVDVIVRTRTEGGVAPRTGCDAGHVGSEVRIPYRGVYLFFRHP